MRPPLARDTRHPPTGPQGLSVVSSQFKGVVVAAPYSGTTVTLSTQHTDVTSGEHATVFQIQSGDARIYVRAG